MGDNRSTTTTRYGRFVYNPNDIYIGRALEYYGEAHEIELQLLRQLCEPGSYVFDAGANVGDHTVALAHHVGTSGRVFAFEPQRAIYSMLCENVAQNGLANVECVHAALGATSGTVLIPELDYGVEANYGGFEVSAFDEGSPVPRVTLDDYRSLPRADLVKIDVEGMELDVLRGAEALIERFRPVLYVENDRVERSAELIAHVQSKRYRLFWHLAPLFNAENFRKRTENLFPNVVATNMLCVPSETPLHFEGPGFDEIRDAAEHPFKGRH
ncbi:MAG: FkbM family methyltransferase [Candidatus Eremiobacteraeota bacterium]|nr:FkbM family methyltransferase [Candidatus Eremiobacteraeota bacterium]